MRNLFFILFIFGINTLLGQGSVHINDIHTNEIVDRFEIKTGIIPDFYSNLRPYNRRDITNYIMLVDSALDSKSKYTQFDIDYIYKDNNEWLLPSEYPTTLTGANEGVLYNKEHIDSSNTFYKLKENPNFASQKSSKYFERDKPILKYFYKTPANFYEVNTPHFYLRANPIINFQYAIDGNDEQPIFKNLRGLELRAGVDDRIYFYTNVLETQERFPKYVNNFIDKNRAIPGAALYKSYVSTIFNINRGYDFLNAQALLGFNITKHVGVQFGHGSNFIGNGYRSVLLSNFSANYLYLKLNWRVGKFQLQNIFAEAAANSRADLTKDGLIPKKYFATHYFGYRPFEKLQLGLFETVVFHRENGFELQYLNPIILYRTVEQYIGSPDNVLLGLDAKWNFAKGFQFYGQLILDEFKFDELFLEKRGWWANKYAAQLGIKAIDVAGVETLDIQLEYNLARPYTYSSRDSTFANYGNYNQALAHPLGANFKEVIGIVKYRPIPKLYFQAKYFLMNYGENPEGINVGANILLPNTSRASTYGNFIGQGTKARTSIISIDLSYQVFHNGFIDLTYFQRIKDSADDNLDLTTRYFGGGLRLNIGKSENYF